MHASSRSRRLHAARAAALALLLAVACSACAADDPVPTFDPTVPCTQDGQQAGAYPDLEASLPATMLGREPASVVSGRTCTQEALGTLAGHGIEELRFAGATWEEGSGRGFTVAVFEADALDAQQVVEFYEAGSRATRPDDTYQVTDTMAGSQPAVRLDVSGADGSTQTVVAWPVPAGEAGGDDRVQALLVANLGRLRLAEILQELGAG